MQHPMQRNSLILAAIVLLLIILAVVLVTQPVEPPAGPGPSAVVAPVLDDSELNMIAKDAESFSEAELQAEFDAIEADIQSLEAEVSAQ